MPHTLILLGLAIAASCANGVKHKMSDDLPTCVSLTECESRDGARVRVVGVYMPFSPMPNRKRDDDSPLPVRIELSGGGAPLLEPYWHQDAARPVAETARYAGKQVRVVGTFHMQSPPPPDPGAATLGGPCICPVESIELVE